MSQFAPHLSRAGFDLTIHPLFDTAFFRLVYKPGHYLRKTMALVSRTCDRIATVRAGREFDAVLIYREAYPIGPPLIERLLARRGLPIVYDFDDAVFLPNTSEANQAIGSLKNPGKVAEILRLSTHVMAGNSYLADYARRHARRSHHRADLRRHQRLVSTPVAAPVRQHRSLSAGSAHRRRPSICSS